MNTIHNEDCLETMSRIKDNAIDLIVTSPPYNIRNSSGGGFKGTGNKGRWKNAGLIKGYDTSSDDMPYDKYVQWQRKCLSEMTRIISDKGAVFYNHKWRVQNGLIQDRKEILEGFPVRQIIIWQRSGGVNFNDYFFGRKKGRCRKRPSILHNQRRRKYGEFHLGKIKG